MLHIEILPVGVKRVVVTGDTPAEQDLALIIWPFVRPHVDRIDRQLRREAPGLLDRLRESSHRETGE